MKTFLFVLSIISASVSMSVIALVVIRFVYNLFIMHETFTGFDHLAFIILITIFLSVFMVCILDAIKIFKELK